MYLRYDAQVFPSASINLELPRGSIIHKARQLAGEFGYNKLRAIESTQFTFDEEAKIFLEYCLGISEANKLMKDDLPIWSWRTRFCRQYEQEESRIWLSPAGQLYGLFHEIENDRKLPSLPQSEALALAKHFIEDKAGLSLVSFNLIKSASFTQKHRTDYAFTWQDTKRDFNGAKLRLQVGIAGNLVNQFNYFLYVPESFERKFHTLRSYNELYESIASIFYSLLQVASVFIFIWAFTTRRLRWRFALGVAGLMTCIDLLESFNNIASVIDGYNTQKLFSGYLMDFFIQNLTGSLSKFISYMMLAGATELVYRLNYPTKIACENFLSPDGIRSKPMIIGSLLGHILLGIDLGWIIAYYLSGQWWHIWCPSGVDNYQVLSTVVPCLSAIATGVSAAINEEFLYRVLALSLFQRLTRLFWLANIFQAAAWGFMHSTYPQEPAYARGLELTAVGMFHGWILRRYGLFPCLVAHYLFDALADSKPLFGAHDLWLKGSALIPVLPFLLLYFFARWRAKKRGYSDESALQNFSLIDKTPSKEPITDIVTASFQVENILPLAKAATFRLLLLTSVSLLAMFAFNNYEAVNKDMQLNIERTQAIALAKEELIRQGIDPQPYKNVATLSDQTDALELQYVFEQVKLKRALDVAKATGEGMYWEVRFFKPLDPKEYEVLLNHKGAVEAFSLTLPEDAPGARLSAESARSLVESYLKTKQPQWQPYKFENLQEFKRTERTDYTFTYTVPSLKVSEADFKVSVSVLGNIVSGIDANYDLPDQWLNEHNKRTIRDEIFLQMRNIFNVCLCLAGIVWIFGLLKTEPIRWKIAYLFSLPLIGLSLIESLNSYPQFYRTYLTTLPLYSFLLSKVTGYMDSVQWNFLYYFCGFAAALLALYTVLGKKRLLLVIEANSWLIALSLASLHIAINALADTLHAHFSPACPLESLSATCSLANVAFPWLAILAESLSAALNQLMLLGILAGLYKRFCSGFTMYVIFIIVFNLITYSSARYWQDFAIDAFSSCLWEIIMWYFVVKIIRFNPLVYFFIGFIGSLMDNMIDMLTHVYPIYLTIIIVTGLFILAPGLYALYWRNNIIKSGRI